ncbi:MAG: sulfatase-like hydrolase/transferase [Pseudomonadota bacterium]
MHFKPFAVLALVVTALLSACGETETAEESQPHIILITAGDVSVEDISAYGGPIPTPNIERLAKRGILFTKGYAAAAQAGPSRAALMSGQYPQRFGFMFDTGTVRETIKGSFGVQNTDRLLQERLRTLGYETALFGSWNLGAREEQYPMLRGFDYFWGTLGDNTTYIAPRAPGVVFTKSSNYRLPPSRSRFNAVFAGGSAETVKNTSRYLTDDMGAEVVRYINKFHRKSVAKGPSQTPSVQSASGSQNPLFLMAAFHAPRAPLTALKSDFEGLPDLGSQERNTYGAMVRAVDRSIGRILDALDKTGMSDNALIIFTADRGCDALVNTCPCETLRAGASTFYEGGLRVPYIVAFPGGGSSGLESSAPVMPFDITATIMDYADPQDRLLPEFDGRSLTEIMNGKAGRFEKRPLFWQQTPLIAVLMDGKKLIRNGESNVAELYDLTNDPGEQNDIASTNSYIVSDMETRLDVWQQTNTFPGWETANYGARPVCGRREFVANTRR